MKVLDRFFFIIRIVGIVLFITLASVGGYFIVVSLRQERKDDHLFCSTWNKQEVDDYFISKGIASFESNINCNTYYLELTNFEVEKLLPIADEYYFALDIEFIIVNENQIIFGQFINQDISYISSTIVAI